MSNLPATTPPASQKSPSPSLPARRFCVAPMMAWTDRHCRYFHRLLTRHALLYTEMLTADAVIHGDRDTLLRYHPHEHPLALQLGGSDPGRLAQAAHIAAGFGYDEINLNVGCPSDRVQSGRFGACLMAEPALVGDCVRAMQDAVGGAVPITVKCRIGIDALDSEEHFTHFVDTVAAAGCRVFIVHARKAWLQGLSPKENRDIPPLDYARVHRLKRRRPHLEIILNGGITSLAEADAQLAHVDGVMLGRAAYHTPALLAEVDGRYFSATDKKTPLTDVIAQILPYIEMELARGTRLSQITRHMTGLFHGMPGARAFRRLLSEQATRPGAGVEVLQQAFAQVTCLVEGDTPPDERAGECP